MSGKLRETKEIERIRAEREAVEARIHSIETMGLVDGPGVRTLFFLQGCPLRCAFCHNPDSQEINAGKVMTAGEVVKQALRYRTYYGTDGGVTFSGGEPLLQGEFLAAVLPLLKEEGINTCLDTSAFGDPKWYKDIFPYVDTMLLDVKQFSSKAFYELVEGRMEVFLQFIQDLEKNGFHGQLWIRHVMVPGLTDNEAAMDRFVRIIQPVAHLVERIEILPYHVMGVDKYKELGRPYKLEGVPPMDKKRAKELQSYAIGLFHHYLHLQREERMKEEAMSEKDITQKRYLSLAEKQAISNKLREIPLLEDLGEETGELFLEHMQLFRLDKGNFVFQTGDPADSMFVICEGHVKIFHNTADGKEQIFYIYQEGDFVGGLNVLQQTSYIYMGQALEDCLIASIPKSFFDKYMLNNPAILQRILAKSFDRIRWAEDLISRLSTNNAAMKAAALLLRLKDAFGIKTPDGIRLDLSLNREEMGNYSGLTRETMTRKLGEFKDLGYIDYIGNKVIIIKDLAALEDYCL